MKSVLKRPPWGPTAERGFRTMGVVEQKVLVNLSRIERGPIAIAYLSYGRSKHGNTYSLERRREDIGSSGNVDLEMDGNLDGKIESEVRVYRGEWMKRSLKLRRR